MKTKHMIGMSLFAVAATLLSGCATSPVGEYADDCAAPVGECLEPAGSCPTTLHSFRAPIRERIEYRTVTTPNCY